LASRAFWHYYDRIAHFDQWEEWSLLRNYCCFSVHFLICFFSIIYIDLCPFRYVFALFD